MGYDLHIARALWWVQHARYPILAQEVLDLVRREADLTVSDGPRALTCAVSSKTLIAEAGAPYRTLRRSAGRYRLRDCPLPVPVF
jgi:hypothetical protein